MIYSLIQRYEQEQDITYYQAGIVASAIYNISYAEAGGKDKDGQPLKYLSPRDFVPRLADQAVIPEEDVVIYLTQEETIAAISKINDALDGFDGRHLRQERPKDIPND